MRNTQSMLDWAYFAEALPQKYDPTCCTLQKMDVARHTDMVGKRYCICYNLSSAHRSPPIRKEKQQNLVLRIGVTFLLGGLGSGAYSFVVLPHLTSCRLDYQRIPVRSDAMIHISLCFHVDHSLLLEFPNRTAHNATPHT